VSGAIAVFAKLPRPGQVKTRLCPPFSPEQAASLYACMLDDVLETTAQAARELALVPVLAVHPPAACSELARRAPGYRVLAQRGKDLAERMERAVSVLADQEQGPVLLRGSDSPALAPEVLGDALAALREADLVLSPDRDGGYNLVGLRRPVPGIFRHPMSTPEVLSATLANARKRALRARVLATAFDIDVVEDLHLLAVARREGAARCCLRTLAWLDHNRAWPG